MMQTILQVQDHCYPFGQLITNACSIKIQDVQSFHSLKELQEKKSEMLMKTKLISSPFIIKLLNIYQQDLNLHYIYEYVPHSLCSYLRNRAKKELQETALVKKISFQLTMLISYLVDIKLEIQLTVQNLGFSKDEKLKLFMNSKCKMGHKTQFSLVTYYGHCKQNILRTIQSEISRRNSLTNDKENSNFSIKGNKLTFEDVPMNYSVYQNNSSFDSQGLEQSYIQTANEDQIYSNPPSIVFDKRKPTASCINQQSNQASFLRQTQSSKFGNNWRLKQPKNGSKSAQKEKVHKNSFHFGTNKPKHEKFHTLQDQTRSLSHSRSIRIELQQMKGKGKDKKRKDSYKVKITSQHQYQIDDCNPLDLLGKSNGEQDFISNLLNKAKNYAGMHRNEKREEEDDIPSPKKFMRKESTPQYANTADISQTAQQLGVKVQRAKQKAELVLKRYMKLKKTFSCNQ